MAVASLAEALGQDSSAQFEKQVLPLLEGRCVKCHSGSEPAAKLDVRTRAGLLNGGVTGPAIVPGSAEKSLLYQRVRTGQMPLGGPQLAEADLDRIRRWIEQGALGTEAAAPAGEPEMNSRDRGHWAFRPPKTPPIPKIRSAAVQNPIDAFLLAQLERKKLSFSAQADRITLLRRACFDLIGLPPTPEEVDRFLADKSSEAYEKTIDQLLASPHYGERWARHWLDVAGYADSEGGEAADVVRTNAWRYRDYVIRAFNNDKPYDVFLREQLAGDELSEYWKYEKLPPKALEQLEATGYLRMAVDGSLDTHTKDLNVDYLWKALFDTQQIVASSILGLTLQCARCHDHKYEAISQKDYYRVQALFAGAWRPDGPILVSGKRTILDATPAEKDTAEKANKVQQPVIKALKDLLKARAGQYRAKHPKGDDASEEELRKAFPEYAALAGRLGEEIKQEEARRIELPEIRAFYDVDGNPPAVHVLRRGDYGAQRGEQVSAGVPSVLDDPSQPFTAPVSASGAKTSGRRMAFAKWLTGPDHPLTGRVMVNRIWAHHFGAGIVASLDNFGRSGEPPSNAALLDWLATEFVRQDWSIKAMHRLMMTSSAYRQSSQARADGMKADPENKLLWRMNPRRAEAEIARDSMLSAAGALDPKMFGEAVKSETKASGEIVPEKDTSEGRRSIYLIVRRSAPQTLLNVLGAPVMEVNCTRRAAYNSASQALTLMNGEFIAAQAEHFARRVLLEKPPAAIADPSSIEYAFRLAFSRKPSSREKDLLMTFVERQAQRYTSMDVEARRLRAYAGMCQSLLSANEFIYID